MSEKQTLDVRFDALRAWGSESRVIGIGTDICEVDRLRQALRRQGRRLRDRLFTEGEVQWIRSSVLIDAAYASAFAVKEATAKALGTGINGRVDWSNIELLDQRSGRVVLTGGALRRANRLAKPLDAHCVHLHLSVDEEVVVASILLESFIRGR